MDHVLTVSKHPFVIATVLDPQLKGLPGFSEDVRSAAYNVVREMTNAALPSLRATSSSMTADTPSGPSTSSDKPPAKRAKVDSVRSATMRFLLSDGASSSDSTAVYDFDQYLSASAEVGDVNVLDWWHDHERQFPSTAFIAMQFLSVPATSVQSERLFSATERLISKLSSRLLPDSAEMLIFLNKNNSLF